MTIGGLQKSSLLDYPGKIAAVVFTVGCNFRCGFCHNPGLVVACAEQEIIPESDVLAFLAARRKLLDAVVITGGEPTLQHDLRAFIRKVREMGYVVKLDTNGTDPRTVKLLIDEGLVDYYAMDIKHRIESRAYERATMQTVDIEAIRQSIALIKGSGVDYEFRTTLVEGLHTPEDVIAMAEFLQGAKRYMLQKFIPREELNDETYKEKRAFSHAVLEDLKVRCSAFVDECDIR